MDTRPAGVEVRQDAAGEARLDVYAQAQDRFEDDGLALRIGILEGEDGGHAERLLVRIDGVVFTIDENTLDADDGEACQRSFRQGLEEAFLDGGEVVFRDGSTEDVFFKDALFRGLETHLDDAIEAASAGLFDVTSIAFRGALDGFTVDDLHPFGVDGDLVDGF